LGERKSVANTGSITLRKKKERERERERERGGQNDHQNIHYTN
jgi:hypothetical protein